jgi:flagellar protein FlaG
MAVQQLQGVSANSVTAAYQDQISSNIGNNTDTDQAAKTDPGSKESAAAAAKKADASLQEKRVKDAAKQLNDFMDRYAIELRFSVDSDTKQIVVKVLHQGTGELIRQIPSAEALKISKAFDTLQGLLIRKTV